ncbi:uncharacterized protein PAN0_003c1500 [Moesziomyces antarcticus]|uniref:Uncharacterized protein n=1 Tax=Pseudozyma antarctica TaxID=84753 RepID=A0A5C3FKC8_PSEA2|nr:uncharacterized protein PAN0_003c1500 [Moesziomyces antarcticus]GAK63296.1 conserved hypothetical protein [Moesziomyces antarcticus]SPO43879.1 uncharacterized protein PSANT_01564 [Moesziomyces antarcticus]
MVNLPKPTVFLDSIGLAGLSRPTSSRPALAPAAERCLYQFGLAALPSHGSHDNNHDINSIAEQLLTLSCQLCIPAVFGRGDGQAWTLSESDYPALLRWKQQQVPTLLHKLFKLLEQLSSVDSSQIGTQLDLVLGHVVCTLARFLPPSHVSPFPDPDTTSFIEGNQEIDDGWIGRESKIEAHRILGRLGNEVLPTASLTTSAVAGSLLAHYIKPIVKETSKSSSASLSSVDPETGRKKAPATGALLVSYLDRNLGQHRFSSAADDNEASNLAPHQFALSLDSADVADDAQPALHERNEALGCVNVLAWCLDHLELETESDWNAAWPLLVPPLLTLLEHAQPRFRLRGSMLVHQLLDRPSTVADASGPDTDADAGRDSMRKSRREAILGGLLLRTGIGSLLERALQVNLTYVHDATYAPALVGFSISALRRLILLTTHPIVWRDATQSPFDTPAAESAGPDAGPDEKAGGVDDCGKRRMEALCRLVSQGILSTWSYLPLPPSGTRLGRELVATTCTAYLMLIEDLSPPPTAQAANLGAAARFVDVSIDWIFRTWLSTVAFDNTEHINTTVKVVRLATQLLLPGSTGADESKDDADGQLALRKTVASKIGRNMSLILSAVAKCWISALESPLRSSSNRADWPRLERCLVDLMQCVSLADSTVPTRCARLVALDARLADLLPTPDAASGVNSR